MKPKVYNVKYLDYEVRVYWTVGTTVTINAGSPAEALCKAGGLTPEEAMEESQSSGEIMEDSLIVGDGEVSPNYMSLEDGTIV